MIKRGNRVRASQSVWIVEKPRDSDRAIVRFGTISRTYKVPESFRNSNTRNSIVIRSDDGDRLIHEFVFFRRLNKVSRSLVSPTYFTSHNRALKAAAIFNSPEFVERRRHAREKLTELLQAGFVMGISELSVGETSIKEEKTTYMKIKVNKDGSKEIEETEIPKWNDAVECAGSERSSIHESNGDSERTEG